MLRRVFIWCASNVRFFDWHGVTPGSSAATMVSTIQLCSLRLGTQKLAAAKRHSRGYTIWAESIEPILAKLMGE